VITKGKSVRKDKGEQGSTLLEFTFVAVFFFMMLIGIVAIGNLYFTHNALVETTRRGARYAAMQAAANPAGTVRTTGGCDTTGPRLTQIRNYAIYGNEAGTGSNLLNLQPTNICVEYNNFGMNVGSVSVSITGYTYNFVIPGINRVITMPAYRSTAAGETAGVP
jgi:TadE-like protein